MVPSLRPSSSRPHLALRRAGLRAVRLSGDAAAIRLYAQDRYAILAPTALLAMAIFQALSYLGGLPASWLADRRLGAQATTLFGAGLLACGYSVLAMDLAAMLWPALAMMVAGHSFF